MKIYQEMNNADAKKQATKSAGRVIDDNIVIKLSGQLKDFLTKHGKLVPGQPYEVRKSRFGTFLLAVFDKELFEKKKQKKITRVYGPYVVSRNGERYFKTKSYFTPKRFEIWDGATVVE